MDILNIYNLSLIHELAGFTTEFFYMKWRTIMFQKQVNSMILEPSIFVSRWRVRPWLGWTTLINIITEHNLRLESCFMWYEIMITGTKSYKSINSIIFLTISC